MESEMKKCPFCAELIRNEAIKCRYCGSMLTNRSINFDFLATPGHWHRVNEGKKVAGVCTGIARELDSPVLILPLRIFFILTTIFYGFGIILYIILWIMMPSPEIQGEKYNTPYTTPPAAPPVDYAVNYGNNDTVDDSPDDDTIEIADDKNNESSDTKSETDEPDTIT